jgi:alpha-amylase/alpha-mannosidase (GH57 family)
MKRYICIHGHFYQPPRENPWLEDVELQDSAYPFHDWNERITDECYQPNTASRILDDKEMIRKIVNNYAGISFNFGPTLLSWLEVHQPETYLGILEADRQSVKKFSGHGSALAQAYNHMIMPLANTRDKRTQVLWGIRDFVHRFGRPPEGMWLPETAVDLETLEVLASEGIAFTILAPHQAGRVRMLAPPEKKGEKRDPRGKEGKVASEPWQDVGGGKVDPRLPYLCRLPSGGQIALFFYDGPMARDVAFGGLLNNGVDFAQRLVGGFGEKDQPQLVHIATDGESYGHHHRFGDMALAFCLQHVEANDLAAVTVYGEFLEKYPPTHEVEIIEETSWSCAHGIERWRSDCGCRIEAKPGWDQAWRTPLREALDWLRDGLSPLFEQEMSKFSSNPWQTREAYIEVILDRSPGRVEEFLSRQAERELSRDEQVRALHLLEMQRQAMLMYTSCGWFFDEISGIETTQILGYASRAMQLAQEFGGADFEGGFLKRLEKAPSNLARYKTGAAVFRTQVKPMRLDLIRVAAHHAIASQFDHVAADGVYCYAAHDHDARRFQSGNLVLSLGRTHIHSKITWDEGEFAYAVLYIGGNNLNAGIRQFRGEKEYARMVEELRNALDRGDVAELFRRMDTFFGSHNYTLWHLFKDEQRRVLSQILESSLEDVEDSFRRIYETYGSVLRFLQEIHMPAPEPLARPVELFLNARVKKILESAELEPERLRETVEEVRRLGIDLDRTTLEFVAGRQISSLLQKLQTHPADLGLLEKIETVLELLGTLPLRPDLWQAQNLYYRLRNEMVGRAPEGSGADGAKWQEKFRSVGRILQVSTG